MKVTDLVAFLFLLKINSDMIKAVGIMIDKSGVRKKRTKI